MRRVVGAALAGVLAGSLLVGTGVALGAGSKPFPDVPSDAFYTEAVRWAKANGITTGYGSTGNFEPSRPTTRAQMVTFLQRLDDHRDERVGEVRWARVQSDGTLREGKGVESVFKSATDYYAVTFDRDVSGCLWQATGTVGTLATTYVAPAFGRPKTDVTVRVYDPGENTPRQGAFDLLVLC